MGCVLNGPGLWPVSRVEAADGTIFSVRKPRDAVAGTASGLKTMARPGPRPPASRRKAEGMCYDVLLCLLRLLRAQDATEGSWGGPGFSSGSLSPQKPALTFDLPGISLLLLACQVVQPYVGAKCGGIKALDGPLSGLHLQLCNCPHLPRFFRTASDARALPRAAAPDWPPASAALLQGPSWVAALL